MARRNKSGAHSVETHAIHGLDAAWDAWPRGDRVVALQVAAEQFRSRFKTQGEVGAVRSFDIAAAPYPVKFAFHGAARTVNPYVSILNRMLVIQFEDFSGTERILLWEPTVPEGAESAPFYAQLAAHARRGPVRRAGRRIVNRTYHTLESALAACALSPELVDFVAFDHLHVQDPRRILPKFANARMIVQNRELATLESLHPMQRAWYVEGGMDGVDESQLVRIDGSIELGTGVAIVATPGHTDGNQSLVINTPSGVWVSSENGVSADNWQPDLSKIPGVRRYAQFFDREVCPNANTLEDSIDQYDSMVVEKYLADLIPGSPWLQILPSSELVAWRHQWPVRPTHWHGPLSCGRLQTSQLQGAAPTARAA